MQLDPPAPIPAVEMPLTVPSTATTIPQQVEAAQVGLHSAARDYFASHPSTDRTNAAQHAQAVLRTELARAAIEQGPKEIREQVVEPAERQVLETVAALRQGGSNEDLKNREWAADKGVLDSKKSAGEAVAAMASMLENAENAEQLAVRIEQIPRYCESRDISSDFVLPVLSRRAETAEVAQRVIDARKMLVTVEGNASMLKRAISQNRVPASLISTHPFDQAVSQ